MSKYADYTVEVDVVDSTSRIWYEDRGPDVLKVHYRVFRIPSRRAFVIRHFAAATATDRGEAEAMAPRIPRLFEAWEGAGRATKRRHPTKGHYYWSVAAGTFIDDPLVQLELEMMIDRGAEVDA